MTKLSVGDVVVLNDGRKCLLNLCYLDGPFAPEILGIDSNGAVHEIYEHEIKEIIFHDQSFVDSINRLSEL